MRSNVWSRMTAFFFEHPRFSQKVKIASAYAVIVFVTNCCGAGALCAAERDFPFYPGEKLTFEIKWEFIPAGEVVLEVLPIETIKGIKVQHFVLITKTNSFIDLIYKVRQRIDAYTDIDVNRSILYKEVYTMHKSRRDAIIDFDWKNFKAQYTNFGKKEKPVSIIHGAFDPFSILYYARHLDFKENDELERPVTDGKKCVIGRATVVKREKVMLDIGEFDTFLMEPELKEVGGVFKKSKGAKIKLWVTADERKIPVKIKSKVIVGSFVGELISIDYASE